MPALGVEAGSIGTIVHVYPGSVAYEVELFTPAGETIDVVTLNADQVASISFEEVRKRRRREVQKGLITALNDAGARYGPRLTLRQVLENAPNLVSPDRPSEALAAIRSIKLVDRRTGRKIRRCVFGGSVIYDLKAVAPKQRRDVVKAWNRLRKSAQCDPLGEKIPMYQKQLGDRLEALK